MVSFLYNLYGFGAVERQISPILAFLFIFPDKMPKTYLFMRVLQPRGYIAECFSLLRGTYGKGNAGVYTQC